MKVYMLIIREYEGDAAKSISFDLKQLVDYYKSTSFYPPDGDSEILEFEVELGDMIMRDNDGDYVIKKADGSIVDGKWIDVRKMEE